MRNHGVQTTRSAAHDGEPPDPFIPTRRTLLSRIRNLDDSTSWQDFFDTYWKLIYQAARKSGLSDDEAHDVVQTTVLTVARKIQQFKYDPERGTFKGWLRHMTRWRILDRLDQRHQGPPLEPLPDDTRDTGPLERIPDPLSDELDKLWDAEWQQNLMDAAIQRIKRRVRPKHFQVFELHVIKQWPPAKVAKTLGVNIAQVHLIKHRVGSLIKHEVKRLEAQGV